MTEVLGPDAVERFLKLKALPSLSQNEKAEYEALLAKVRQLRPELEHATEDLPDQALNDFETTQLQDLNSRLSSLSASEKHQREALKNKVRKWQVERVKRQLASGEVELGDPLAELINIVGMALAIMAPTISRNAHIGNYDTAEVTMMHKKIKKLAGLNQ